MKTSISLSVALSRSSRMVDAGRGATVSAIHLTPRDLILRSGPWAASRRMIGKLRGLMVRPAMRSIVRRRRFAPPHHEELLACRAGLRLQIGAAIDARHPRQQILDFSLGGGRD